MYTLRKKLGTFGCPLSKNYGIADLLMSSISIAVVLSIIRETIVKFYNVAILYWISQECFVSGSTIACLLNHTRSPARSAVGTQCTFSVPAVEHSTWTAYCIDWFKHEKTLPTGEA